MPENYIGEFAGLGAALAWAIASILFRRLGSTVPPLLLNLYKGTIAIAMLLILLTLSGELLAPIHLRAWGLLLLSGAIGIGVGDTAFLACLNRLGERRTLLMAETLTPPMTAIIALVFLAEFLSFAAVTGIALTVAGVAWVIVERRSGNPHDTAHQKSGILLGLLAALCQSIGAVISRDVLTETEVGPVWSSLIRIIGGIAILLLWLPAVRQAYFPASVRSARLWGVIVLTTFVGTFLGIMLQQLALERTEAGIAQTLLATSSLFILPLVVWRGESVSLRAILGAALAVVGIAILFAVK